MANRKFQKKGRKNHIEAGRRDRGIIKAISGLLYLICAVLFVIYAAMLFFRFFIGNDFGANRFEKDTVSSFESLKSGNNMDCTAGGLEDTVQGTMAAAAPGDREIPAPGKSHVGLKASGTHSGLASDEGYKDSLSADLRDENQNPDETFQRSGGEPVLRDARLLFGGNLYLSSYVLSAYDNEGIGGVLSPGVMDLSNKADFFMVNQVFPLSERGEAEEGKEYAYRVYPERVSILKAAGIDCVSLANNHVLDYGYDALSDTIETLDRAGIAHGGAGKDHGEASRAVIRDLNGMKTAVVSSSRRVPDASWGAGEDKPGVFLSYDANKKNYLNCISELNRSCDLVISYIYWGRNEGEAAIPDYMKILANESIDAGADLVICSAYDSAEGVEYYKGVPIVYSLGDFLYGSSIDKGYLLEIETREEGNEMKLKLYSLSSEMGYTYITDAEEAG